MVALAVLPRVQAAEGVRTVSGSAGELTYQVLLPAGYDASDRRYPVLYLITGNGGSETSAASYLDLASYAARDEVILVTPAEPQHNNLMPDWADGTHRFDADFATLLVPKIDAEFRTLGDRGHRAIAGVSAGGYSSMAIAARHPDLFVAAATFSGLVDITDRGPAGETLVEIPQSVIVDMQPGELFRRFGNPYSHPLSWIERNPADLVSNLRGMSLYAAAGDGVPSDADDVTAGGPLVWQKAIVESQVRHMTARFVRLAGQAAVPITYRPHAGTHLPRYWAEDLGQWWPQMLAAFGSAAPTTFDYRSAAATFTVWGWTFAASPDRAAELLDVTGASADGITLSGSGTEQVTTGALFPPFSTVGLEGAREGSASTDADGRLTFTVDLGPAHLAEQFTAPATGETFVTKSVSFVARPG